MLLVGCSSAGGVATPPPTTVPTSATTIPTPSASDRPLPELVPADGTAWFGIAYPWGENEMPAPGDFRSLLTGAVIGAHEDQVPIPDFYATYAEGHDKPMGVFETAALFNPSAGGPAEGDLKEAWWEQVTAIRRSTTSSRASRC